jgi:hypothetical protein
MELASIAMDGVSISHFADRRETSNQVAIAARLPTGTSCVAGFSTRFNAAVLENKPTLKNR